MKYFLTGNKFYILKSQVNNYGGDKTTVSCLLTIAMVIAFKQCFDTRSMRIKMYSAIQLKLPAVWYFVGWNHGMEVC